METAIEPTESQSERGTALGLTAAEIQDFVAKAQARDKNEHVRQALFANAGGEHITLPLLDDETNIFGTDARLEALMTQHNEQAEKAIQNATELERVNAIAKREYCAFARYAEDKTLLNRYFGGNPTNRDAKLIPFLKEIDKADVHLLAHDFTVEWGEKGKQAALQAGEKTSSAELKNRHPIAADTFDPKSLKVVISRDPIDIAGMSTGRRWELCTAKEGHDGRQGSNYHIVPNEIEEGRLVAYLVHQDDEKLEYPLMRVLLKPFHNDQGETILVPNNIYTSAIQGNSATIDRLLHTVRDFLTQQVNHGKSGSFTMNEGVYSDGQERTLSLDEIYEAELGNAMADDTQFFFR
jgi:hypothetical protein